jgi:hypothetical protein
MWNAPIIDDIHKTRDQHAAKFDHDMRRIFDDLKRQEKESGLITVSLPPKQVGHDVLAA